MTAGTAGDMPAPDRVVHVAYEGLLSPAWLKLKLTPALLCPACYQSR